MSCPRPQLKQRQASHMQLQNHRHSVRRTGNVALNRDVDLKLLERALARGRARRGGPPMRTGRLNAITGIPNGNYCPTDADMGGACPELSGNLCRDEVVPLNSIAVAAGATAAVQNTSLVTMRGVRYSVSTTGTAGFTFTNLTINNTPQMQANGVFYSDMFAPDAEDWGIRGDAFWPGSILSVSVTNLDGGNAQSFFSAVKGPGFG
jgi:hypothetical protein